MLLPYIITLTISFLILRHPAGESFLAKTLKVLSSILCVWMLVTSFLYILTPGIQHQSEVSLLQIGVAWAHGQEVYTPVQDAHLYSQFYGPLSYLLAGGATLLFGNPLFYAKIPGVLSFWLSLFVLWRLFKSMGLNKRHLFSVLAIFVGLMAMYYQLAYSPRPDAYMLLCTCLALTVVLDEKLSPLRKYLLGGLLTGICMSAKIHGVFFMVPLLVHMLLTQPSGLGLALSIVMAFLGGFGLFLVDGVSFMNFWLWLREIARHGLDLKQLMINVTYILPFVFTLGFVRPLHHKDRIVYLSLLVCAFIIAVFASKPGAGPNHFIALYPLFLYFLALSLKKGLRAPTFAPKLREPALLLGLVLMATYVGILKQKSLRKFYFYLPTHWREYLEVKNLVEPLNEPAMMVTNDGYYNRYKSYYAPYVAWHSKKVFFDPGAVMDMDISGLPIPEETLRLWDSCYIPYLVVPKSGTPFAYESVYKAESIYPEHFVKTFRDQFKPIRETANYTLYHCEKLSSI